MALLFHAVTEFELSYRPYGSNRQLRALLSAFAQNKDIPQDKTII